MEFPKAADETDRDYGIHMVQCAAESQLGDFSKVTAWEIERVVTERTEHSKLDTWTTLLAFDDQARYTFEVSMFGEEAEDDLLPSSR